MQQKIASSNLLVITVIITLGVLLASFYLVNKDFKRAL